LLHLQARELFARVVRGVDFAVRLGDHAVLVDDVRDAARVLVGIRVGGAVREAEVTVRVAEQRKGEAVLFGEALVRFPGVETDAEDPRVFLLVLAVEVPEPGTFARSARCVGLRIKPEHDLFAAQIREPHAVAVVIADVELGSGIARLQHVRTSDDGFGGEAQDAFEGHWG
jgi:hypothetical protein